MESLSIITSQKGLLLDNLKKCANRGLFHTGEMAEVSSLIQFSSSHPVCLYSADVHVVTTYVSNNGTPRVLAVTSVLPTSLLLLPTEPSKEAEFKLTLALSHPAVPLNQLFSGTRALVSLT